MANRIPKLKQKADQAFSEYVRLRDCTDYMEDNGLSKPAGKCITCPKFDVYTKMDCGHFISRNCTPLRWDERNASLQCKGCNMQPSGEQYKHGRAIIQKFGTEAMDDLLRIEQEWKGNVTKLTVGYLERVIEYYKNKTKGLTSN